MFATQTKDAKIDDTVEIAFNLDKAYTVDSFQWKMTYDDTKLKLNEVTTPGVDITVFNTDVSGEIRAAASNAVNPFEYAEGDTFVLVKFDVIGGGETTVDLNVQVFEEHEEETETTVAPEETTVEPEETTVAPEETTVEPEETTVAPEETTVAPEETTAEPEETTAAPEETTAAPEETTVAPEETTAEAATDATSATGEDTTNAAGGNASTSDSASGSSSSGAVQTGSASMAIIILLVLVSATAGIYFTRKRREDK